ncbi:4Fe-4S ferredoxin iron-sulfur binding domain protein [Candidatus Zixiibacteriota bacterium]|nr:4Fe-4S ferredoxin iron-sulfur binding domain protein [candidate division Zixibacteria bacterium]
MSETSLRIKDQVVIQRSQFQSLLDALIKSGYDIIGPTLQNKAIAHDHLQSAADLPIGWTDEHGPGKYRLKKRQDGALFGYVLGPFCWKKYLFPSQVTLWEAHRSGSGYQLKNIDNSIPKTAFLGARPCELHAIAIQDKIFMQGEYLDPIYKVRREKIFVVAVNCADPGETCFCASMNTGPKATAGFDIALTEIIDKNNHYFAAEIGTSAGAEIMNKVKYEKANAEAKAASEETSRRASENMGKRLDTRGIKELLYAATEHPRWDDVASRCLSCANCTMVCPTCFCMNIDDVTNLNGTSAERRRRWDSCFTLDHSYIHGGSIRVSAKSRYRQWLTHKLAAWIDQFGSSGCVGCGRCITWCPAGIDMTEEIRALRDSGRTATAAAVKE